MLEFAKLCEQIDELLGHGKYGFHWRQCREKFGSARWYWKIKGERKQALQIDIISGMQAVSTALKSSKPAQPLRSVQDQIGELIGKARVQAWEALYRSVTKDSEVPKAEFQFVEMPARDRPLKRPIDAHQKSTQTRRWRFSSSRMEYTNWPMTCVTLDVRFGQAPRRKHRIIFWRQPPPTPWCRTWGRQT